MEDTNISEDLSDAIKRIKTGQHPDIVRISHKFAMVKEKKVLAADTFRKLAIQNINNLYNYEVHEASKIFEVNLMNQNLLFHPIILALIFLYGSIYLDEIVSLERLC